MEKHQDDTGLPTASSHTRIPGTINGHRILCADMPRRVYFIHQAILRLEKTEQGYLEAWYVGTRDGEGHWLDPVQRARQLGLNYGKFCENVRLTREKLLTYKKIWLI